MQDTVDLRNGHEKHVWNSHLNILDIDEEKLGSRYMGWALTRLEGGTIEGNKTTSWRRVLENVREKVQVPLPSPFMKTNVIWKMKVHNGKEKRHKTQQVLIPWNQL